MRLGLGLRRRLVLMLVGATRWNPRARRGAARERVAAERDVRVDVDVPGQLRVGAGGDVVERILAPLIENG